MFQLTCHIKLRHGLHFVHTNEGEIGEIRGLRLNFYGVKSEAQYTTIKVTVYTLNKLYMKVTI